MDPAEYKPSRIQQEFHLSNAREVLFAGAAGPGKSLALLWDPIITQATEERERWARGEIRQSVGHSIYFRRTVPRLLETIKRAHMVFPVIFPGCKWDGDNKMYIDPCGYRFQFAQIQHEDDADNYRSQEYCMAEGEKIRMADGSLKAIEDVRCGDFVWTLEGGKMVTATHQTGVKPCVSLVYLDQFGSAQMQVHPTTHPVLLATSEKSHHESLRGSIRSVSQSHPVSSTWLDYESLLCGRRESQGSRVSSINGGIYFGESDGSLLAVERLPELSVRVVLASPPPLLGDTLPRKSTQSCSCEVSCESCSRTGQAHPPSTELMYLDLKHAHGQCERSLCCATDIGACGISGEETATETQQDFCNHCSACSRRDDGQLQLQSNSDREHIQRPGDVEARCHCCLTPDDLGDVRISTPSGAGLTYRHFYTGESRTSSIRTLETDGTLRFCGYRMTYDLTVQDVNHYISEGGVVNLNSHISFDEATEFTKYQYDIITARLRSSDAVLRTKLRIRLATNPGRSPGTDPMWIKNRFVDPAPKGRKLLRETVKLRDGSTETLTRLFIPATLHDNPDPEFRRSYEATLLSKPAHIREAWLNGRWDFVDGAFFSEAFVHDVHVIKPFEIPRTWTRYRSMDWGHKTHGVVLWWALDGDGNLTCYREFTFKGMDAESVALAIREIEIQQGDWNEFSNKSRLSGPADWQIHEERGNQGPTIAESMGQFGVTWERCSKGRKSAAMELIRRLTMPIRGKDDRPNICWFDTCTKCIETIPSVGCNENDPEEPIKDGSTHWLDATFYGIMWRAALPVTKAVDRFEHVDELERKRRSKVANRGRFGY